MLLAVPATIFIADARVNALRSGILPSAIVFTWSQVMLATFLLLGSPEPYWTFAASLVEMATGGCLTSNEKDLSE